MAGWALVAADAVQPLRAAFQRRDRTGTGRVGPEAFRDVLREAADVLPRDADRLFRGCARVVRFVGCFWFWLQFVWGRLF